MKSFLNISDLSKNDFYKILDYSDTLKSHLDDCLKNIYLLRQIHTALGKDMNRLQRVLISNSESEIDISKSYPGLTIIKNKPDKLSGLLNNISSKTSILLVDPLGNVILRYDNKFEGKKLLKDIKKLFKLSRIG